jgi:hypothetical protein
VIGSLRYANAAMPFQLATELQLAAGIDIAIL